MKLMLKDVRLAFPKLFMPDAGSTGGEPKYSCALAILPGGTTAAQIDKAICAVAEEKWGAKSRAILADLAQNGRVGYKKHGLSKDGVVYEGFQDMHSVNTSNTTRPYIVDRGNRLIEPTAGIPYAGCYVNVSVDVWAQDNSYGKRINFSLRGVQFVRDGEAFGGGAPAGDDEFENLGGEEDVDGLI